MDTQWLKDKSKTKDEFLSDKEAFLSTRSRQSLCRQQLDKPTNDGSTSKYFTQITQTESIFIGNDMKWKLPQLTNADSETANADSETARVIHCHTLLNVSQFSFNTSKDIT